MAKISKQEILKLAHISHIKVNEEQIDTLVKELEAVLTYASGLQDIARAYGNVEMEQKVYNVVREDIVIPCDSEPLLNQAPASESHFFVVPKIISSK